MPGGPVKTKPLQICFIKVSTVTEKPQLLHISCSIVALRSESLLLRFISKSSGPREKKPSRNQTQTWNRTAANSNHPMTSAKIRLLGFLFHFFFNIKVSVNISRCILYKSSWLR